MANQFNDLPRNPPSNAGLDFNYAVWSPGTIATLANVRWNQDYRDIVYFDNQAALNAYIDTSHSTNLTITEMSYARPGAPVRIALPLASAMKYNYIRVYNPAQPVGNDTPMYYYYFITEVKHLAPNTTEIYVQLDVIQTFIYGVTFGRAYVEAGHLGIANSNGFKDYGRSFLTVPEGLDLGNDYQIDYVGEHHLGDAAAGMNYQILVLSTVDLTVDPGTVSNPTLETASGSQSQNLPNGATLYKVNNIESLMNYLARYPWISQGIIGIWAFPLTFSIPVKSGGGGFAPGTVAVDSGKAPIVNHKTSLFNNWRESWWAIRMPRYRHLKKFLTYPYSFLELTTNTGQPIVIKPELWNTPDADITLIPHYTPPNLRVVIMPSKYNEGAVEGRVTTDGLRTGGEFLDFATSISNFPSFSIVNDSYIGYMASNANSIQFQNQSADWSQQKVLTGNQLASDQASSAMSMQQQQTALGIATATSQTDVANSAQWQRTGVNAVGGILGGAASGGIAGAASGVGSAITGAIGTGIDVSARNQQLALSNNQARRSTDLSISQQQYMRDSNRKYADYAAQGDYRMAIASINAKLQDARLTQPTTSGQMGGESFVLAAFQWGYQLKLKTLADNAMVTIGEHWLRYGYSVNRYFNVQKRLHCMTHFTYWKMQDCTIVEGAMPETFKQTIRGIFEKGVTVWRTPNDIGNIDRAVNEPLEGFTLTR